MNKKKKMKMKMLKVLLVAMIIPEILITKIKKFN